MKAIRLKNLALLAAIAGAMFVPLLHAIPAQAATAFVKATGNDGLSCLDELNACLTLDKAITVSGQVTGKILIVGHGDFQGLTSPITGSVSIIAPDSGVTISQNSLSQPVFTINSGLTDTVTLKNLSINGGTTGTIGVQVNNGGKVYIMNCTLRGYSNGAAQAMLLQPNPGAGNQSQLYISNTEVSNANTGLIYIAPQSGSVKTYFTHIEIHNTNGYGIKADGTNGGVDVAITDSAVFSMTGSAIHGVTPATASPGTPVVRMSVERTTILNSGGGAVVGNGGGSRMLVNKSSVMSHALGIYALNGGTVVLNDSLVSGNTVGVSLNGLGSTSPVFSYANNVIQFNGFAQCGNDVCNGASPGTLGTFSLR